MKRNILLALIGALAIAVCSGAQDMPSISGQWAPASAQLGGKVFPVSAFQGATLQLTADTYAFGDDQGTISLPAGGPPSPIDITGVKGPNAGRTIPAIYEFSGDGDLTICYELAKGGARPTDFTSPEGSQILLVRYKRVH